MGAPGRWPLDQEPTSGRFGTAVCETVGLWQEQSERKGDLLELDGSQMDGEILALALPLSRPLSLSLSPLAAFSLASGIALHGRQTTGQTSNVG